MQGTAQRFALPALGGLVTPSDADNAEACKMLVEAAESTASGARFVRPRPVERERLPVKRLDILQVA